VQEKEYTLTGQVNFTFENIDEEKEFPGREWC